MFASQAGNMYDSLRFIRDGLRCPVLWTVKSELSQHHHPWNSLEEYIWWDHQWSKSGQQLRLVSPERHGDILCLEEQYRGQRRRCNHGTKQLEMAHLSLRLQHSVECLTIGHSNEWWGQSKWISFVWYTRSLRHKRYSIRDPELISMVGLMFRKLLHAPEMRTRPKQS